MKQNENFLQFEVVWKDEHILELEVGVSNNGYSGVARGYDTGERLEVLAKQLKGFPKDDRSIFYEIKGSMGMGTLSFAFCLNSPNGIVGIKVHLEGEGSYDCQNSILSLELLVEPSAIDIFQKYLTTLAANQQRFAKLIAR